MQRDRPTKMLILRMAVGRLLLSLFHCLANVGVPAEPEAGQKEIFSSWALFILIMLLIAALFASYMLQHKKIQAVHETVISIFAG